MAKKPGESPSKEMEALAKAPWFQFSLKKVLAYFLLVLVAYALVVGFLLFFPPYRTLSGGALVGICDSVKGTVPVIAVIMLFFSVVFFTASRVVAGSKKALTEIAIALLFGFVSGLLLAAFSRTIFGYLRLVC
jgi:hypothetical protein